MYMSCSAMRGFVILINFNYKNSHSNVAYIRATFDTLQTMNDEWEAISGHCPPSSAILDHLPYKSCWEVDIRSRRLLEANGSKWQPLEGINDYWGPSWVYWDWFLLEQLGAINVRACLSGSRHIVQLGSYVDNFFLKILFNWSVYRRFGQPPKTFDNGAQKPSMFALWLQSNSARNSSETHKINPWR